MVRRESDGSTLYWIQDGQKVSVTQMEYQYGAVAETQGNQITSARVNKRVRFNYCNWVNNIAQVNEDASRPYPPYPGDVNDDGTPIPLDSNGKPLMWSVADPIMYDFGDVTTGKESWVPWVPPLPVVKKKV